MVSANDIVKGVEFSFLGVPSVVTKATPGSPYVTYVEKGNTGEAMIDRQVLVDHLNAKRAAR